MPLTTKQRQYLKGLGHPLKPVIQVGKEGLTDRVIASISKALLDHELIKINILETALLERNEAAEEISTELKAEIVQILGRKKRRPQNRQTECGPCAKFLGATPILVRRSIFSALRALRCHLGANP